MTRTFDRQIGKARIKCKAPNLMTQLGLPDSCRPSPIPDDYGGFVFLPYLVEIRSKKSVKSLKYLTLEGSWCSLLLRNRFQFI